ncbi:MAG: type II secretion system protein [Spartobacteria bacterium]|nr:type II secretion system protein [Spartobacteria bacterium]
MNIFSIQMKCKDRRCGFTMIEFIVILMLVSIITTVAVSKLANTESDLISARDKLIQTLSYVRSRAMSSTNSWSMNYGATNSFIRNGVAVTLPNGFMVGAPSGVTLTSGTVSFDVWGAPDSAKSITLTDSGGSTRTVTIAAETGYIE